MQRPYFSIVLPTYNRAKFILTAVKSVINQTFNNWELIIIDDGSTDNTRDIINRIKDERVIYHFQENKERSAARNKGISLAKGEFICFLDSDDYFYNNHLELLFANAKMPAFYYTGAEIKKNFQIIGEYTYFEQDTSEVLFAWRNPICVNSTCIHRSILERYKFAEEYNYWEDRHLFIRILTEYPLVQIFECTVCVVDHSERSVNHSKLDKKLMKDTQVFINCINDLHSYSRVNRFISPAMKKNKITEELFFRIELFVKKNNRLGALKLFSMVLPYFTYRSSKRYLKTLIKIILLLKTGSE